MKLYYIINARIPTEKAHGIQVMKMCEAFAREGKEVILVVPRRHNTIKADPFLYYGVERNFTIKYLPVIDLFGYHIPFVFSVLTITFAIATRLFLLKEKNEAILYTRGETPFFLTLFLPNRFKLFWETHIKPKNIKWYQKIFTRSSGIIVVTEYYQSELTATYNIPSYKILCAADGVDLKIFDIDVSKEEARAQISLPLDKKIVMYTGHLYSWKGADVLATAAQSFTDNVLTVFVGGTEEDLASFRKRYGNDMHIRIIGQRPHTEIPLYLKAADVLVLPNTAKEETSRFYTSPIKLFEYMASGRPIIASDIPSIRDVLNEKNAMLVSPDDPNAIVDGVSGFINDDARANAVAKEARKDVGQYTWSARAKNILSFVDKMI